MSLNEKKGVKVKILAKYNEKKYNYRSNARTSSEFQLNLSSSPSL